MKTIVIAAAAASLLAAPAFAQTTRSVDVTGNVAKLCGLDNQSGGGTGGYTPTVALGSLVNNNGQLDVAPRNIGFGNVWCNAPATLTLAASKLTTATSVTDTASFTNKLDLVVDNATGDGGSIFAYLGGAASARSEAPVSYALNQEFETGIGRFSRARLSVALPTGTVGNDRPVAGAYTGSVTLTVTPN